MRKIKIDRRWTITPDYRRATTYRYDITDLTTGEVQHFDDSEIQQFFPASTLERMLGTRWTLERTLGDYSARVPYEQDESHRLITVFRKKAGD